jgi:4-hydroxybenzoate polyprenyltransferase
MNLLRPEPATSPFPIPAERAGALALLAASRPRQWTKNLLLFAGLIFAERFDDAGSWARAIAIFCAYCAVSSSAYLVNDVHDIENDRRHPTKRFRPIARGELSPRAALTGAGVLFAAGLAVAAGLGTSSLIFLAGFAALQAAYSLALKRIVGLDVLTIAGFFVLRAAAGAAAVGVRISPWLLSCTALLALFLALSKRRSELVLVANKLTPGRPVLESYSLAALERLAFLSSISAAVVYAVYAFTGPDSPAMALTIPFVWLGVGRYLYLVERRDLGEEPEQVLFSDRIVLGCVGCFALSAMVVLTQS